VSSTTQPQSSAGAPDVIGAALGGLLFARSDPPPGAADAFNEWYDGEHVPLRMAVPGFLNGRRYRSDESPHYLAIYDLTSPSVTSEAPYRRLAETRSEREAEMLRSLPHMERRVYRQIDPPAQAEGTVERDTPFVLAVAMTPPSEQTDDFNAWYRQEHTPSLLRVPGWERIRRFELVEGSGPRFLALHDLAKLDMFDTPEYQAVNTPWSARVRGYVIERERGQYKLLRSFKPDLDRATPGGGG
jgi:hypothetical protein